MHWLHELGSVCNDPVFWKPLLIIKILFGNRITSFAGSGIEHAKSVFATLSKTFLIICIPSKNKSEQYFIAS